MPKMRTSYIQADEDKKEISEMSFVIYDLTFLALFTLAVVLFLYRRRKNLKRQGVMYLYRTNVGLRFMNIVSKRYSRILKPMQYVIIASGYILMVTILWFLARFTYEYTKSTLLVRTVKIPPLVPLVPYLPEIFKVDFLPPFYFTYWIVIIAIIAISHEFAHGIFARLNNIRVKSTGFGFLGPFLAAFVEPDEKQMAKSKKFAQLSILAAGTFANVLMTALFGLLLWAFFAFSFGPAGVNFNAYGTAAINVSSITAISGVTIHSVQEIPALVNDSLTKFSAAEGSYLASGTSLKTAVEKNAQFLIAYEDAPAINSQLKGPITAINGFPVRSIGELRMVLQKYRAGATITISSIEKGKLREYKVKLAEKDGKAYLGIGVIKPQTRGISGFFYSIIGRVKDPTIYYAPSWGGDFSIFIYNLLWWTVLINISVALVNMLPVGIFDGGRFFYLTLWGITGSEKAGKKAFTIATWLILALFLWLMIRWTLAFI